MEVRVVNATGVEENDMEINIYPNPTSNSVNIEANNMTSIRVSDIMGQVLMERYERTDAIQIDLSGFANGQYFIQVNTDNGVATRKIVKM